MTETVADEIGHDRQREQVKRSTSRLLHGDGDMIDQEARDLAKQAMARGEAHEDVCTERWTQSRDGQARVEGAVAALQNAMDERIKALEKAMNDRIGKMPASVIAALTGLVGFLAARAFPVH
ncbi:MAG: hypothetical protein WDM91_10820 [Rhizomicrobium sp.]